MQKGNEKQAKNWESNKRGHMLRQRDMEERLGREAQEGRGAEMDEWKIWAAIKTKGETERSGISN